MKFKSVTKWAMVFSVVAFLCAAVNAQAQSADSIIDLLIRKGIITDREGKELKEQAEGDINRAINRANKSKVASAVDSMTWSGDFRIRAEFFDFESNPATGAKLQDDRLRYRFRLRYGFESKMKEWATIGFRVATGGDDPVSTNQSLQDTFSRKPINIDLAFVTIQPPQATWLTITGGKMKNPIWQTGISSALQYDGDITPEGIAQQVSWTFGENKQFKVFGNFGQFALDEVSGNVNDQYMFDFQGGLEAKFKRLKLTGAVGYYLTHNLDQMGVASSNQPSGAAAPAAQSTSPNRGNDTVLGAGGARYYVDNFKVLTLRGEAALTVSDKPLFGTPFLLTLSGEYIENLASDYDQPNLGDTEGFAVQLALGEARRKGQWQLAYQYKYLEANATWDVLTDSDWGSGGTDRRGHVIRAAYNPLDWWQLTLTVFMTDKMSNRANSHNNQRGFRGDEMTRIQLDSAFRF